MVFVVRRLQELGRASNVPINMCFIDLQKAYDSVDRTLLWEVLARFGVPSRMITIIRMFHDGMRARVQLNSGELSAWFHVCQGLRKGCASSLLLSNILRSSRGRRNCPAICSGLSHRRKRGLSGRCTKR